MKDIEFPDISEAFDKFIKAWENIQDSSSELPPVIQASAQNALLIPSSIQVDEDEGFEHDVIVTYNQEYLWIEARNSKMQIAFNNYEFMRIVAFVLDNGFDLSQKENKSESGN